MRKTFVLTAALAALGFADAAWAVQTKVQFLNAPPVAALKLTINVPGAAPYSTTAPVVNGSAEFSLDMANLMNKTVTAVDVYVKEDDDDEVMFVLPGASAPAGWVRKGTFTLTAGMTAVLDFPTGALATTSTGGASSTSTTANGSALGEEAGPSSWSTGDIGISFGGGWSSYSFAEDPCSGINQLLAESRFTGNCVPDTSGMHGDVQAAFAVHSNVLLVAGYHELGGVSVDTTATRGQLQLTQSGGFHPSGWHVGVRGTFPIGQSFTVEPHIAGLFWRSNDPSVLAVTGGGLNETERFQVDFSGIAPFVGLDATYWPHRRFGLGGGITTAKFKDTVGEDQIDKTLTRFSFYVRLRLN